MNSNKTLVNFLWRFFERCGAQLVSLIVTVVLARILDPNVYGSIALVTVIISFLQIFVDSGLGTALIQKKDADDVDFSSVLYFKIATCFIIYIALFLSAPFIANFYDDSNLIPVIRVLGVTVIIASVKNVEQAYVSRHLKFKAFFYATLIGTIISAVVGIVMAINGFEIWALVAQTLTNEIIDTILLWIIVKWRPKKVFSFDRIRKLTSFGWKIFLASLIDNIYENARQLVVGKQYSSSDLAYYNRGKQFPNIITVNLSTSLDSVLLPTMSNVQDDIENVKKLVRKSVVVSGFLLIPLMFGMCACSEPIIHILLTEKWSSAIPFMQIFGLSYAFYSINSAFKNGIKSIGKSNVFLVTELIKKIVGFGMILVSMFISVEAIALSFLASSIFNLIVNVYPSKKFLGYSIVEQVKDIFPNFILSTFMLICIFPVNFINISYWLKLLIMVPSGCFLYFTLGKVFHFEGFEYYWSVSRAFFRRKKRGDYTNEGN